MTKRATTIWTFIVVEVMTALCVFLFGTATAWKWGVHGACDHFRGSYFDILISMPDPREFYHAVTSPNVLQYWGLYWPEHLIAALCVWCAWRQGPGNLVRETGQGGDSSLS